MGDRPAQPAGCRRSRPDQQDRDLEHRDELVQPAAKGVSLGRLCSADLAARSAVFDWRSGLGYNGPLFLDGEEVGNGGRAFAHAEGGISWELPSLGKFSWENAVANPATGRTTVVVGTDDTSPLGQVYVYVGEKKATGNPAERAGLTGGTLYGIKVPGTPSEPTNTGISSGTAFTAANLGNVANKTGAELQADSVAAGVTGGSAPRMRLGIHGDPRISTSRSRPASRIRATSTGSASTIRRTRLQVARSTSCSPVWRPVARPSGSTCSTTSRSTVAVT
jgi:hypothetical protein